MVGADSYGISRAPQYSGVQSNFEYVFAYKTITFFGCPFQNNSTNTFIEAQRLHSSHFASHDTHITTHASLHDIGLGSSLFAHHYLGNHIRFLFLALLRCFSSCRSLFYPINSDKSFLSFSRKISQFGNLRIIAYLSAPRSLSQTIASFIAFWCQGIHQMLFSINQNLKIQRWNIYSEFTIITNYKHFKDHKKFFKNFFYHYSFFLDTLSHNKPSKHS